MSEPKPTSIAGLRELVREVLAEVLGDEELSGKTAAAEPAEAAGTPEVAADVVAPEVVVRVEHGALTEAKVREAARAGARIILGPRAVMTPLASDRARSAGVVVERETRC